MDDESNIREIERREEKMDALYMYYEIDHERGVAKHFLPIFIQLDFLRLGLSYILHAPWKVLPLNTKFCV